MSGIFDRIFRYRQREHSTPRENYFTETLVEVLKRHKPLGIAFVERLIRQNNVERENIATVHMETQKNMSMRDGTRRQPDIWVEARDEADKRHVVIIENKIDSYVYGQQLSDYADILEREQGAESKTLVCIAKHSVEPDILDVIRQDIENRENICFVPRKWFQVYRQLSQKRQLADGCAGDLGKELLILMEDWNMDGTISAAQLRAGVSWMGADVGGKLCDAQNEAWSESRIDTFLNGNTELAGRWQCWRESGGQQSALRCAAMDGFQI